MTKPSLTQLYRFSRELEADSAQLSADLAAAFEVSSPATHRRNIVSRRIVGGSRRWRGVAALAASLVVAFAVWNVHRPVATNGMQTAQNRAAEPSADHIFAGFSENSVAARSNRSDEIFHGEFLSDEIFNSKTHDG